MDRPHGAREAALQRPRREPAARAEAHPRTLGVGPPAQSSLQPSRSAITRRPRCRRDSEVGLQPASCRSDRGSTRSVREHHRHRSPSTSHRAPRTRRGSRRTGPPNAADRLGPIRRAASGARSMATSRSAVSRACPWRTTATPFTATYRLPEAFSVSKLGSNRAIAALHPHPHRGWGRGRPSPFRFPRTRRSPTPSGWKATAAGTDELRAHALARHIRYGVRRLPTSDGTATAGRDVSCP